MESRLRLFVGRICRALILSLVVGGAAVAQAAPAKIFVASYGNDANSGSPTSPKRAFQAAHDALATGGQIVVLDTAGYGAFTITKSLSVTVPPGVNGFVTVSSGNGVKIDAGASARVNLRGLIVEGSSSSSGNGIYIVSALTVILEDCTVRNINEGIYAQTNTPLRLNVANCRVRDCAYGLDVETSSSSGLVAVATGCRLENCWNDGLYVGTSNNGAVGMTASDCTITGCGYGIINTSLNTLVRFEGSRIVGNSTGVAGSVLSRG